MLDQEECRMLLFDNVENSAELHSKVMSGEDLGCALIKPSLILDPLQVNIAVFKAKHRYALVTTSISIFCSLFIMKDHETHNQGLCQLFLTLSWDIAEFSFLCSIWARQCFGPKGGRCCVSSKIPSRV